VEREQRSTSPTTQVRAAPLPFVPAESGIVPQPWFAPGPVSATGTFQAMGPPSQPSAPADVRATIAVSDPRAAAEALPFKSAGVFDLSIEQYAALAIELEAYPQHQAQILGMYGIQSEAAWRACESLWAGRLVADPSLRQRWIRISADLRNKLVKR
jgi:hypothetical protein